MRETKNVIGRAMSLAHQRADRVERLRTNRPTQINLLTIRCRAGYKCISSSTEDHDADDEDPDN